MHRILNKWAAAAAAMLLGATLQAQTVIADFTTDTGLHGQGDGSWAGYTTSSVNGAEHIYGPMLDGSAYYFVFSTPLDLSSIGQLETLIIDLSTIEGNAASTLSISLISGAAWDGTAIANFDLSQLQEMSPAILSAGLSFSNFDASNIQAFSISSLDFDVVSALNIELSSVLVTAAVQPAPTPTPVPEPATNAVLLGSAVLGLGVLRKRRQSKA